MATSRSGLELIQALKAASDPPSPGGKLKIEIVSEAWNDKAFYLPGKAELLCDFILGQFVKDKENSSTSASILDTRFWKLLHDLSGTVSNTHLASSLHNFPFTAILSRYSSLPEQVSELLLVSSKCLRYLWKLAAPRLPIDLVLESFAVYLPFAGNFENTEPVSRLGFSIVSTLRSTFNNLANKRKWYITYVNKHLHTWLEYCRTQLGSSLPDSSPADAVYNVGIEILFNPDTLKALDRDDDPLFSSLTDILSKSPAVVSLLPRIFRSYIHALKVHKNAIFDQGSARASSLNLGHRISDEALRFYASIRSLCDALPLDQLVASTRVALLAVVEENKLYTQSRPDIDIILRRDVDDSLKRLSDQYYEDIQECALDCLCTLTRIDYNLIHPSLEGLVSQLLSMSTPKSSPLIHLLTDYHSKARSLDIYIHTIFGILKPRYLTKSERNGLNCFLKTSSSILLDPAQLLHLGNIIQKFMTPVQTLAMAQFVAESIQESWNHYHDLKKKTSADADEQMDVDDDASQDVDIAAIAYSHICRLGSVVLASLPIQTLTSPERDQLLECISEISNTHIKAVLQKTLKISAASDSSSWSKQIVAAASLRLRYSLCIHPTFGLDIKPWTKLLPKSLSVFLANDTLPELQLELFRTLLLITVDDVSTRQKVLDNALTFVDERIEGNNATWNGSTYLLARHDEGRDLLALALLHLLLQRWLPSIDSSDLQPQLKKLVLIIIKTHTLPSPSPGLSASAIVFQALQCSHTWELHTLRDAYITTILDIIEHNVEQSDPRLAVAAFECLLAAPLEYLTRSSRIDLVKRACSLDTRLSHNLESPVKSLVVLRTFLARYIPTLGPQDFSPLDVITHLFTQHHIGSNGVIDSITVELVSACYRLVLQADNDAPSPSMSTLLVSFSQVDLLHDCLPQRSALRFVDMLTKDFRFSKLPSSVQEQIRALHQTWLTAVTPCIASTLDDAGLLPDAQVLSSWIRVLSLGRWIGDHASSSKFGARLFGKSTKAGLFTEVHSSSLIILIEELAYCEGLDCLNQLDIILAAYVSSHSRIEAQVKENIETRLSKAVSHLTVETFAHVLDSIVPLVSLDTISTELKLSALHITDVLLRDPPQGSLKITQKINGLLLKYYADTIRSLPETLQTTALQSISRTCADKPASLRLVDVGNIWIILSGLLEPSRSHDSSTSHTRFQDIVTIIGSVMRLRRDLLVHSLPQLGHIIRRLLLCLRTIRPNLGATQKSLVTDTFPTWIACQDPLQPTAAKSLARLCETISAKTVVRSNNNHQDQKPESLSKPFSKHASYVLKAYVDAMNDPLCIMPLNIRKELQPGLYTLCGMLNEHSRNGLMASVLDAGAKLTLKTLWQEYEKQRYQGQG